MRELTLTTRSLICSILSLQLYRKKSEIIVKAKAHKTQNYARYRVQHDILTPDFFTLLLCNLGQVHNTLSDLIQLIIKLLITRFQLLNLHSLTVRQGRSTTCALFEG
jgi:hypothetical protein